MKTRSIVRTLALAAGLALPLAAQAQLFSTGFTYQGQLKDGAALANGAYEMVFNLCAASSGPALDHFGSTGAPINVPVVNGLFIQELQFAQPTAYSGQDRWLEIQVRPQGGTTFTTLTPRQRLSPTPYAIQCRGLQFSSVGQTQAGLLNPGTPANQYNGLEFANGSTTGWSIVRDVDNNLMFKRGDSTQGAKYVFIAPNGYVSIGQGQTPTAPLQVFGHAKVNVLEILGGSDIAEPFAISAAHSELQTPNSELAEPQPGMIVTIDPDHVGGLKVASAAYDHAVAGVISGAGGVNAGMVLRQEGTVADGQHPVALSGRVWCLVDADANGPVHAGDLITTSGTPGHGMKATDSAKASGAVIGKAMSSLESGRGLVLVLVNLQ